jgi:ATP-binding cassette subfamily B protein
VGQLFRLLAYLKNHRGFMVASFLLLIVSVALNLAQPKLIEWAVDFGIRDGTMGTVIAGAAGIFAAAVVSSAFALASGYLLVRSSQGLGHDLRTTLYQRVMAFSFTNLDNWRIGELMSRLNTDVRTVMMFVRMGLLMILQSLIMIAGSLVIMYATNARLATVMAIFMPSSLAIFFVLAVFIKPLFMKVRTQLDRVNNVLQENLAGAKVVRAFSQHQHEVKRFEVENREFFRLSLKVGYVVSLVFPLLFLIGNLAITVVVWVGGRGVLDAMEGVAGATLTLGQLVGFSNYAMLVMMPVLMLGFVLNFIAMAAASATRISEVLKETPSVQPPEEPVERDRLKGKVEFQGVCFAYGHGEDALHEVNLVVRPGERVGILGRTGSGKSSLAYLIPRFYDPRQGSVLIDDVNIREYGFATLRTRVALVLQETILFSGTVGENIAFGRPDATQREIEEAAELAAALEFIREKDNGFDEHVGERGMGLSGGQRQRIAIARAIVAKPDVLILDDATSSLDLHVERTVVDNIYQALSGRTTFIISQKISTLRRADRILVMEGGTIAASGTHEELLKTSDVYRQIYETQSAQIRA